MKIKMKIKTKLLLSIAGLMIVASSAIAVILYFQAAGSLSDAGKADLEHIVSQAASLCQTQGALIQQRVDASLKAAELIFRQKGGDKVLLQNNQLFLFGNGDKVIVNNNMEIVDAIQSNQNVGSSIFQVQGNQALRIASSIKDEKGNRSVGSAMSDQVYREVIQGGQTYSGRAQVNGEWYISAYAPIRDINNRIVGAIATATPEKDATILRQALLNIKIGQTGYIYCMDGEGTLTVHPKSEGQNLSSNDFAKTMMAEAPKLGESQTGWVSYKWNRNGTMAEKITAYRYFPRWNWIIAAGSYMDEFTAGARKVATAVAIIAIIAIAFGLLIGWVLANSIVKPLHRMVTMIKDIAQGEGDLTKRLEANDHDEIGELATWFNTFVNKLHDIISQIAYNTEQLASAANEISSSAEELSAGAKEQTNQTAQVSAAVEEMTATIVESSRNTAEAADKAKGASDKSQEGSRLASDTSKGMNEIVDSSNTTAKNIEGLAEKATAIGEIIKVIDDIADQTNLLALNAAIEAARAGEQGRGFAVVADEVRKLAERTTKATKEVAETIKGIQGDVTSTNSQIADSQKYVLAGRNLVDKTNNSLTEIYAAIETVQEMMRQLATASEQQSAG
jgi:methyl-accepting chemotaxis protein